MHACAACAARCGACVHLCTRADPLDPCSCRVYAAMERPRSGFTAKKLDAGAGVVVSASSALCSIAPAASLAPSCPSDVGAAGPSHRPCATADFPPPSAPGHTARPPPLRDWERAWSWALTPLHLCPRRLCSRDVPAARIGEQQGAGLAIERRPCVPTARRWTGPAVAAVRADTAEVGVGGQKRRRGCAACRSSAPLPTPCQLQNTPPCCGSTAHELMGPCPLLTPHPCGARKPRPPPPAAAADQTAASCASGDSRAFAGGRHLGRVPGAPRLLGSAACSSGSSGSSPAGFGAGAAPTNKSACPAQSARHAGPLVCS